MADSCCPIELLLQNPKMKKKQGVTCYIRKIIDLEYNHQSFTHLDVQLNSTRMSLLSVSHWIQNQGKSICQSHRTASWVSHYDTQYKKMLSFCDKGAILEQKATDYLLPDSFRLHHGGTSGYLVCFNLKETKNASNSIFFVFIHKSIHFYIQKAKFHENMSSFEQMAANFLS